MELLIFFFILLFFLPLKTALLIVGGIVLLALVLAMIDAYIEIGGEIWQKKKQKEKN